MKCLGFLYLYVGRYPRNNASRNNEERFCPRKARKNTEKIIGLFSVFFRDFRGQIFLRVPSWTKFLLWNEKFPLPFYYFMNKDITPLPTRGLYAITADSPAGNADPVNAVQSAIRGGAAVIQYRDKGSDDGRRRREAAALLDVCRAHRTPLIINDDVELAAAIGADGVHIGRHDPSLAAARARLGAQCIIGVSCYNDIERAEAFQAAGADYVAFGSFYPSGTKPDAVPVTVAELREFRERIRLPIAAIGGITPENAPPLIAAGADLVAVIQGVFARPDVEAAARAYAKLF
ncbi:MAG: thiamine-phosphate diphosphorylase [Candidatus Kentron sp. G]|nr:MAG: thiamine-phosphate diphosphorylase [Candidatus Kentron sp. G]